MFKYILTMIEKPMQEQMCWSKWTRTNNSQWVVHCLFCSLMLRYFCKLWNSVKSQTWLSESAVCTWRSHYSRLC